VWKARSADLLTAEEAIALLVSPSEVVLERLAAEAVAA
jgi:hypothetical protein